MMISDEATEEYAEAMNEAIAAATHAEQQRDDALAEIARLKSLTPIYSRNVDWEKLYPMNPDFADMLDNGHAFDQVENYDPFKCCGCISPRMALRLHDAAVRLTVSAPEVVGAGSVFGYGYWGIQELRGDDDGVRPALPPIAQAMVERSREWAIRFQECYPRIANRLALGTFNRPTCVAEEMAFVNIICIAENYKSPEELCTCCSNFYQLPAYPSINAGGPSVDEDFEFVAECAMEDWDVLFLFKSDPVIVSSVLAQSNNSKAKTPVQFLMGICNIHPDDWFEIFRFAQNQ